VSDRATIERLGASLGATVDDADYSDVPEEVRRNIVQTFAVRVTCTCGEQFWSYKIPGHNHDVECPECGYESRIVG